MSIRKLRAKVFDILRRPDFAERFAALAADMGPAGLLPPLFSGICHTDELVHWHAVTCMGEAVTRMATDNMESARVVMRRFMWSLNDESGGIGWGVPEAMAECLARHHRLAEEYTHILVAFMREDGFFLEYPPLQAGLMWGTWRLAATEAPLLKEKKGGEFQAPYLESPHPAVRGLAALSLGRLAPEEHREAITRLLDDKRRLRFYDNHEIVTITVAELAARGLKNPAATD